MSKLNSLIFNIIIALISGVATSQVRLGNNSNSDATHDGWKSNLVINLTDSYTNNSGVQEKITIKDFSFYAHQKTDPVTPFIGILFFDANEIEILAIGTTRTAADYAIGQNTFPFVDGTPSVIYLNSKEFIENNESVIYGETIVTGFLDAHADGTGGGIGSVIPFDKTGTPDQLWYVGGPSGENSASISPYRKVKYTTTPMDNLKRNYHYHINLDIEPADFIHVSRIESYNEETTTLAPGQEAQMAIGLFPLEAENLSRTYGSSDTNRIQYTSNDGHFFVSKYTDETPIEIYGASVENPAMKLSTTVIPIPRTPMTTTLVPSDYITYATDFDYGDDGVTFHDNSTAAPNRPQREAVGIRYTSQGRDVTDIENGEWLEYTIDVQENGWYNIEVIYSGTTGGEVLLRIDNEFIGSSGTLKLEPTTTDLSYASKTIQLGNMTKGEHRLRIDFAADGFHFNGFKIKKIPTYQNDITLGNASNQGGTKDGWKSNLVVNLTDLYYNDSGLQEEITIKDFSFYAQQKGDPVTPFIGLYYSNNSIEVLAIGTTRTANDYQVGQNTFPFQDGEPKVIYLNSDVHISYTGEAEIIGERIVTGFLDANPDGTGGGVRSVIPYDRSGSVDDIWYVGGPSGADAAVVLPYREVKYKTTPITTLKRNYHYNINFDIKPTEVIQLSRVEFRNDFGPDPDNAYDMMPGEYNQIDIVASPLHPGVNGHVIFGTSDPNRVKLIGGGGFAVVKYVDDSPIEVFGYAEANPEMRIAALIKPFPPKITTVPTENTELEASDFDHGYDGETFHDNGLEPDDQLPRNAVGTSYSGQRGHSIVTDIEKDEWLSYTLNVTSAGTYATKIFYAGTNGGQLHLKIDGQNVTGSILMPSTSTNEDYLSISEPIGNLSIGTHVLQVYFEKGGFNLSGFEINKANSGNDQIASHIVPGTIEAEDFDQGINGVAYYDKSTGNNGGAYRPQSDVDIFASNEGGFAVGWMDTGEWLEYTVDVASSGTYQAKVRYSTTRPQGAIHIDFDGIDKTNTIPLPRTGNPQVYRTVLSQNFTLERGIQKMRIHVEQYGININKIDIVSVSSSRQKNTAIDENTDLGIKVYPNPVKTVLRVQGAHKTTTYKIFDVFGKELKSNKIVDDSINFYGLAKGMYIIHFSDANGKNGFQTERIIVE